MSPSPLAKLVPHLEARLEQLEGRLREGDESTWPAVLVTISALCSALGQLTPGARGELLTTREMATRLGISEKTLLKHKRKGAVRPALQRGKLIRWKGNEAVR